MPLLAAAATAAAVLALAVGAAGAALGVGSRLERRCLSGDGHQTDAHGDSGNDEFQHGFLLCLVVKMRNRGQVHAQGGPRLEAGPLPGSCIVEQRGIARSSFCGKRGETSMKPHGTSSTRGRSPASTVGAAEWSGTEAIHSQQPAFRFSVEGSEQSEGVCSGPQQSFGADCVNGSPQPVMSQMTAQTPAFEPAARTAKLAKKLKNRRLRYPMDCHSLQPHRPNKRSPA